MSLKLPSGPLQLGRGGLQIKASGFTDALPVAGAAIWLNVNALTGKVDGDAVATFTDSSGNSRDGTQATGSKQPIYKTGIVNGRPVLRFTAASLQNFGLPNFLTGFTAGTGFFVVKPNADPPATAATSGLGTFGFDGTSTHYPFTDGVIYDTFGTSARKTVGNPTPSLAAWNVYSIRSAANDWQSYLNGTSLFSTVTNTVQWSASPVLGKSFGVEYFNGDLAEFILFGSALSTANRQAVERFLGTKYAITVA